MKKKISHKLFCLLIIVFFAISVSAQEVIYPPPDSHYVFPGENLEDDKNNLRGHAIDLRSDSNINIYLIIYAKKQDEAKARNRLEKTKIYAINELKLLNRIETVSVQQADTRIPAMRMFLVRPTIFTYKIEDGWKGILPLKATKTSVFELLGKPEVDDKEKYTYKSDEVSIQVKYNSTSCEANRDFESEYNMTKDTVLEYKVLFEPFQLSKLSFDRTKYVKDTKVDEESRSSYRRETAFYHNKEDGITIGVDEQRGIEYVLSIKYEPNSKIAKSLKCEN